MFPKIVSSAVFVSCRQYSQTGEKREENDEQSKKDGLILKKKFGEQWQPSFTGGSVPNFWNSDSGSTNGPFTFFVRALRP